MMTFTVKNISIFANVNKEACTVLRSHTSISFDSDIKNQIVLKLFSENWQTVDWQSAAQNEDGLLPEYLKFKPEFCIFEDTGRLMARYCVAFETMKNFHNICGNETLEDIVSSNQTY